MTCACDEARHEISLPTRTERDTHDEAIRWGAIQKPHGWRKQPSRKLIEGPSRNSIEGARMEWAVWQECQIARLYDMCVESKRGRRRGRVRVGCPSAAPRGELR